MGSFYASSNYHKEAMQKVYLMNPTPYALNTRNKDFNGKTSLLGETNSLSISTISTPSLPINPYNSILGSNQPSLLLSNDLDEASHTDNSEHYLTPPFPRQALSLSISSLQQQSMAQLSSTQLQLMHANLAKSPNLIHVSEEDERGMNSNKRDLSRDAWWVLESKVGSDYEREEVLELMVGNFIVGSKYLRATQELLEEVVKPREDKKGANKLRSGRNRGVLSNLAGATSNSCMEVVNCTQFGSSNSTPDDGMQIINPNNIPTTIFGGYQKSCFHDVVELGPSQRQELEMKKLKLMAMLNEVNRRYKRYYSEMQGVMRRFDCIAGVGASKVYTATSIHTISTHFRTLRDTIASQVGATSRALGEPSAEAVKGQGRGRPSPNILTDICEDRSVRHKLGLMQAQAHSWRPQRGLPEHAVSILRAWLFEHFLHPYPKDAEKIMLAKQSGLTRNQVSNWFINARVRLWKPMVEEMYIEEMREEEDNSTNKCCDKSMEGIDLTSKSSNGMEDEVENEKWGGRKRWEYGLHEGIVSHIELNDDNYNEEEDDMVMMMMMKKAKHEENMDGSRHPTFATSFDEDSQNGNPIELVLDDDGNSQPNYGPLSNRHLQIFPSPIYNNHNHNHNIRNNNSTNVSLTLGLQNCDGLSLFGASGQHFFQSNNIRSSLPQMDQDCFNLGAITTTTNNNNNNNLSLGRVLGSHLFG